MREFPKWLKTLQTNPRNLSVKPEDPARPVPDKVEKTKSQESNPLCANHPIPAKTLPPASARFDLDSADPHVKAILAPDTIVAEQFRLLRAKLSAMKQESSLTTLLVTSTVPNEGKTLIACSLAGVFARENNNRVLLIDADLRKPDGLHRLGLQERKNFHTLSHVLSGAIPLEDALLKDGLWVSVNDPFYFLPAGAAPSNPSELLSSRHLDDALQSAKRFFDWVIIDSPPILPLADTSLLASKCDAALLVIRSGKTPTKLARKAIDLIGRNKFCGVVLNGVQGLPASRYYSTYYSKQSNGRKK